MSVRSAAAVTGGARLEAMSLWDSFLNHQGRLIHKWPQYFPAYERHLAPFVGKRVTMWEIGCGAGGSLQMWRDYLGPESLIVGLDIRPEVAAYEEERIKVRIGDQADERFLNDLLLELGLPDIVLDDGSHRMADLAATFDFLYPRVSPHGVYMVEDLHTAYWDEYDGGLRREGSFIELTKDLIDQLHAHHSRGTVEATEFTLTTTGICVYDSLVVFERGEHLPTDSIKAGTPPPPPPIPWWRRAGSRVKRAVLGQRGAT